MTEKRICVFDIEANGLKPDIIWCVSAAIFSKGKWRIKTTTDYDEMRKFFLSADVLVGHNIMLFDLPIVEKLLGIKIEAEIFDTLGFSWYLYPDRLKHGLESWGEDFGIPKPVIGDNDWMGPLEDETQEEFLAKMSNRCSEDVRINCTLYDKILRDLGNLYDYNDKQVKRITDYLMFKLECARNAQDSRWKLDVERCTRVLGEMEAEKEAKVTELAEAMPKSIKYKEVWRPESLYKKDSTFSRPKTLYTKSGGLSAAGEKFKIRCDSVGVNFEEVDEVTIPSKELTAQGRAWVGYLQDLGLPETYEDPITIVQSEKEGNPNSPSQVKDWLYSLGWVPCTYTYKREADGSTRKIEQVRVDVDGVKELCQSVKDLYDKEPKLEVMDGLSVLTHRIGILKGYLENVDDEGYIRAEIQGFTNTLRFKHRVIVNLPGVGKAYGEDVRGVLIAPEGYELVGSDMSSLEDRCKHHYMWDYDPEYVKEMLEPGYDPHTAMAVGAGLMTKGDEKFYKWFKKKPEDSIEEYDGKNHKEQVALFDKIGVIRHKAKTTNYAAVYGAGGATVARAAGVSVEEGNKLVEGYWNVNWSVKKVAEDQRVKTCLNSMWLYNPVSKFWYSLRFDKDRFSTLNQGTGVFCFDVWIKNFMAKRPQITGQIHDEVILTVKKGFRPQVTKLLRDAIDLTNKQLKLNRELDIDIQFGDNYAEIH